MLITVNDNKRQVTRIARFKTLGGLMLKIIFQHFITDYFLIIPCLYHVKCMHLIAKIA